MIHKVLIALCLSMMMASCKTEEISVTTDTASWPQYCLGYHLFSAPPDLTLTGSSAKIETQALSVATSPATLQTHIESQDDFGQAVVVKKINGWLVIVASENLGLTISSRTLVVYGAYRVGSRIVLTRAGASKSKIKNGGNDPRLWAFHARTAPMPLEDRADEKGFCFDRVFFEGPPPKGETRFSASLSELTPIDSRGQRTARSENSLKLNVLIGSDEPSDGRKLAPQPDISNVPGVNVKSEAFAIDGREFTLASTRYDDGDQKGHWYDATLFGQEKSVTEPLVVTFQYSNDREEPEESRALMLGILENWQSN